MEHLIFTLNFCRIVTINVLITKNEKMSTMNNATVETNGSITTTLFKQGNTNHCVIMAFYNLFRTYPDILRALRNGYDLPYEGF